MLAFLTATGGGVGDLPTAVRKEALVPHEKHAESLDQKIERKLSEALESTNPNDFDEATRRVERIQTLRGKS